MSGMQCLACDVSCNGCTGSGNDKCKACSTSGATKYYLHAASGLCLEQKCGNSENFFTPVVGKKFCDVGLSPTGTDALGCITCEIQDGYYCKAKDYGA
jgi:hypothetical protein